MFKKAISLLIALGMMTCIMPVEAMAETESASDSYDAFMLDNIEQKANSDGDTAVEENLASTLSSDKDTVSSYGVLTYVVNLDGTSCTITDCDETVTGTVVIPEKIDGYSVTTIGEGAFLNCQYLNRVEMPDSVTEVKMGAFARCMNMVSIRLSKNLTKIPITMFSECNALEQVIIPEGVKSIGRSAFYNCYSMKYLVVPASVHTIDSDSVFYNCKELKTAGSIGSGCNYEFGWSEKFPDYAFAGCKELESIEFPLELQSIGMDTFNGCSGLKTLILPENVTTIGQSAFEGCTNISYIKMPVGITQIGRSAFLNCTSLITAGTYGSDSNYEFGWTDKIPENAFSGCTKLTDIILPESITDIGDWAFYECKSLKEIDIPDYVTSIGDSVFGLCSSLTEITIPASVQVIGQQCFSSCGELKKIHLDEGLKEIKSGAFDFCKKLEKITIPDSVDSLGDYAFGWCTGLKSVVLPKQLKNIEEGTFYLCSNLVKIEIPNQVETIGNKAFQSCYKLETVILPKTVSAIGVQSFEDCGILDVYFGGNSEEKDAIELGRYGNEPLLDATWHYNSTGPDDLEKPSETGMRIRCLTQWDAENQIAYFADDTLHLGAAVTEETDTAFLANVDEMVGNYVLVNTKGRGDEMVGPDVLLGMQSIEIESRFAKVDEIAADSVTLSTGDKLPFGWEFSVDGSEFPEYQNKFVICSSFENQVFAINRVELAVGTVNGYDKTARTMIIGDTVYQISSLADETVDALLESAPEGQQIYYYADADRMLYRALPCDGAVSEEANFNVDIYRANQLLDPERYVYAASVGQDIARKTPSGTYAEVMSGDGKFTAAVQTWDSSTTAVDILQNGTTGAGKFLVEKKDIYTALILASLQDISEKSAGEGIIETGEKINSALKKVSGVVKDKLKLDLYVAEEYRDMTASEKSEVSDELVKELKLIPGLENSVQTVESIGKVLETTSDVMDLYHSLLNNTYLVEMAESQKQLVAALYENCPASQVSLKAALLQCKTITESSYEEVMTGTLTTFFASQGFSAVADGYWNLVTETAEAACPLLKAMSAGYKAGKTASNLLFNTDSLIEQYYKVVAVTDLEDLAVVTLNQLEQQYSQSQSAEDARTYLAMCDLLYGIFSVDCAQAIGLLDAMDSAALTQWAKLLAGILGNENGQATSYEETQKTIERLKDQYDLNHEHILTVWVEYLPEDYPNTSLYEYYTEMTGKDPLAMQKRLLVACPVNVRILDENGQVVASVVDGRLSASGNVAVRLDGEEKSFYFYDAADYTVEIQGYDSGSMNVTATEYNAQQEEIRSVYYNNVAVTAQSNYQMNVQGAMQESDFLLMDKQGTPIANTLDTNHADEAEMHTVQIENGVLQVGGVFATRIRAYPGQQVYVYASGLSDQQLLRWETSGNAILENETALVTCFVMPDEDVSLKAILTQTGLDPDPGDSDYEIPSGLTAVYGQRLAEVLLPEHWTWSTPDEKVGNVGAHEFEAIYTPDSAQAENPVTEMLTVMVSPQDIAGADVQLGELLTYNGQQQIQSVKAVYKDGQVVTCDVMGNTGRDAGDYMMSISGKGNYTGTVQVPWRIAAADYQFTIASQKMAPGSGLLDIQYEKMAAGVAQESVEGTLTWYLDDKYKQKAEADYRFTGQDSVTLYWIFEPADGQDNYKKDPKRGKTTFELIQKETEQGKNDTSSESSAINTAKAEPVQDVPGKKEESKITQAVVPQTGDPYPLGLCTGLVVVSGIATGCVFLFGRKRSTKK